MKRSKVKYLRDARAIAVAWGAAVYDKRGMREKQLQPVHEAMLRSDFPKKTPFGWPKEDVLAWGTSHLELSKDRRTITRVEGREAKVEGVNSEPGSPQREFGFEEKLTRFSPDYQKRLIGLYDKWLNPNSLLNKSLTQSEKGELEKAGLIVAVAPETEGDGITGGVRGVANHIRNNFPGVVCNHMENGSGIHHVELRRPERECIGNDKEATDHLLVTVQVNAEADTCPVDIECGDPFL